MNNIKRVSFVLMVSLMALGLNAYGGVRYIDESEFSAPTDKERLQKALTFCSNNNAVCVVPAGKKYIVNEGPLYIWGGASLIGGGEAAEIEYSPKDDATFLVVGMEGPQMPKPVFKGEISNLIFRIDPNKTAARSSAGDNSGHRSLPTDVPAHQIPGLASHRLIYFFRTDGAKVYNNKFILNEMYYSSMSSGANSLFLKEPGGTNPKGDGKVVLFNLSVFDNLILSRDYDHIRNKEPDLKGIVQSHGGEGIGLGGFKGTYVGHNTISGVADDGLGLHGLGNAVVEQNYLETVDGKLYMSNSRCTAVLYNDVVRMHNRAGFRELLHSGIEGSTPHRHMRSPTQQTWFGNRLYYPEGYIDKETASRFVAPRALIFEKNQIILPANASTAGGITLATRLESQVYLKDKLDANGNKIILSGGGTEKELATRLYQPRSYETIEWDVSNFVPSNTPPGVYQGCFKGEYKPLLPPAINFLPIAGDNFDNEMELPANASFSVVKNVKIKDNQVISGGNYRSLSIGVGTPWGRGDHIVGYPVSDLTGNSTGIVSNSKFHNIYLEGNNFSFDNQLPCWMFDSSNLTEPGCVNSPAKATNQERVYFADEPDFANLPVHQTIPGRIEAENYSSAIDLTVGNLGDAACRQGEVDLSATQDFTGKCHVVGVQAGESLTFLVEALEEGQYSINFRAQSNQHGKKINFFVDDAAQAESVWINKSIEDFQDNKFGPIALTKGKHKFVVQFESDDIKLNFIEARIRRHTGVELFRIASNQDDVYDDGSLNPNGWGNEGCGTFYGTNEVSCPGSYAGVWNGVEQSIGLRFTIQSNTLINKTIVKSYLRLYPNGTSHGSPNLEIAAEANTNCAPWSQERKPSNIVNVTKAKILKPFNDAEFSSFDSVSGENNKPFRPYIDIDVSSIMRELSWSEGWSNSSKNICFRIQSSGNGGIQEIGFFDYYNSQEKASMLQIEYLK